MKKYHHDHDSHPVRDWSEVDSGGGNRFLQDSTFISIATAHIYHLYEDFLQKAHLLLPLGRTDLRTDGRTKPLIELRVRN